MKIHEINKVVVSLATATLIGLVGCSDSDDSSSNNDETVVTSAAYSGTGVDGILVGSTVCIDMDESGTCDEGEPADPDGTDADGLFEIPETTAKGPLLLVGGTDSGTGLPFTGVLSAPSGSTVVTPLTSAIQSLVKSGQSVADAESAVKNGMGLKDVNVSLTSFDPYNGMATDPENAQKVLASQAQLQVLVHTAAVTIAAADGNATGVDVNNTMDDVFDAIAKNFDGSENVVLDATAVAAATKEVVDSVYENNVTARVAVKVIADSVAQTAVRDADSAKGTIEAASTSDVLDNFNTAITQVNTSTQATVEAQTATATQNAEDLNATSLEAIETLQKLQQEEEAKVLAAQKEREAADAALLAAEQKAQEDAAAYQAYLEAKAAAEAAVKAEAEAAQAKAEAEAAAAAQEKLIDEAKAQAEAEAAAAAAAAEAEAAAAAAREAAAKAAAEAAATLLETNTEATVADLESEVETVESDHADEIDLAEKAHYVEMAKVFAISAENDANATRAIATIYTEAQGNATEAEVAAQNAWVAVSEANATDANSTVAAQKRDEAEGYADIAARALDAAYGIQTAFLNSEAETLALDAKKARIEDSYAKVLELNTTVTRALADVNTTEIVSAIEEIRALDLSEIYDLGSLAEDANASYSTAETSLNEAQDAANTIASSLSTIELAIVDLNETAAQNAEAVALDAYALYELKYKEASDAVENLFAKLEEANQIKTETDLGITEEINAQIAQQQSIAAQAAQDAADSKAVANSYAAAAAADLDTMNLLTNPNIQAYVDAATAANTAAQTAAATAEAAAQTASDAQAQAQAATTVEAATTAAQTATTAAQTAATAAATAEEQAAIVKTNLGLAQNSTTDTNTSTNALAIEDGVKIWDIYAEDDGKIYSNSHMISGTTFTEEKYELNTTTGNFDPFTNEEGYHEYILQNGVWSDAYTTASLVDGVLVFPALEVKYLQEYDLTNPLVSGAIVSTLTQVAPDLTVNFSADAKAYQLGFRPLESYQVDWAPKVQEQDANGNWYETNTTFTTIVDFMGSVNSVSGTYDQATDTWTGVDFERIDDQALFHDGAVIDSTGTAVTYLYEGMHGNLVTVNASDAVRTQVVVGTWSIITLPNTTDLALLAEPSSGNEALFDGGDVSNVLVANVQGTIYLGTHQATATDFIANEDSLTLNDVAYNDIATAVRNYIESNPVVVDTNTTTTVIVPDFKGTLPPEAGSLAGSEVLVSVSDTGVITGTVGGVNTLSGQVDGMITSQTTVNPNGNLLMSSTGAINADGTVTINALLADGTTTFTYTLYPESTTGTTTPVATTSAYSFNIEKVTVNVDANNTGTWRWDGVYVDENGILVVDTASEDNYEENITVDANNVILVDNGAFSVKYLGYEDVDAFNTANGTNLTAAGEIFKVAYIANNDKIDSWGETVVFNGTVIPDLATLVTSFNGVNGAIYSNDGFTDGGLAFGAPDATGIHGNLIIVDNNGTVLDSNAGTYDINTTTGVLVTLPTYSSFASTYSPAFITGPNGVEYADYTAAGAGAYSYFYSDVTIHELMDWFSANEGNFTTKPNFDVEVTDFRAEFDGLVAQDPTDILNFGGDLYTVYIDQSENLAQVSSFVSVIQGTLNSVSDWDSITPVYTDPIGDAALSGLDVTDVKIMQDSSNVYMQVNRAGLDFPTSDYYYNYWVYFRGDDGSSFSIENFHDNQGTLYYRIYDGIGYSGTDTMVDEQQVAENTSTTGMEMDIPASLGLVHPQVNYTVSIFTHGFQDGVADIQGEQEGDTVFGVRFE